MDKTYSLKLGDITHPSVILLLEEHLADMQATSPPESKHALDIQGLQAASVQFWSLWDDNKLVGFAAYKCLNKYRAEIKSMRTAKEYRGLGVADILLRHIITKTKNDGFKELSLETGSMAYFMPARALYIKHGFDYGEPFASYTHDPHSLFMHKRL
ncbi:MAG: putative acetyltransferase [Alphaproteobacteria bacterium]